jgi:hypothetical protein
MLGALVGVALHGWRWSRKAFILSFLAIVLPGISSIVRKPVLEEETVMESSVCLQPMSFVVVRSWSKWHRDKRDCGDPVAEANSR